MKNAITYLTGGSVYILKENILTMDQVLFPGMLLLKSEGLRLDVVEVVEVCDKDGFLNVKVCDNKTGRVMTLNQGIGVGCYVWTLISYDYLDRRFGRSDYKLCTEIEFDFN